MPVVCVRYWAGAKRAAGVDSELLAAETVGELRAVLARRAELTAVTTVATFLVDGERAVDTTPLHDDAQVDLLPPFAGG